MKVRNIPTNNEEGKLLNYCFFNQTPSRDNSSIPVYPYVVGFAGHRQTELDDNLAHHVEQQIISLAQRWKKACNNTAPLVVLSGLYGKAERLMIETAIRLRDKNKMNICVILIKAHPDDPISASVALDNPDAPSDLYNQADSTIVLPWMHENKLTSVTEDDKTMVTNVMLQLPSFIRASLKSSFWTHSNQLDKYNHPKKNRFSLDKISQHSDLIALPSDPPVSDELGSGASADSTEDSANKCRSGFLNSVSTDKKSDGEALPGSETSSESEATLILNTRIKRKLGEKQAVRMYDNDATETDPLTTIIKTAKSSDMMNLPSFAHEQFRGFRNYIALHCHTLFVLWDGKVPDQEDPLDPLDFNASEKNNMRLAQSSEGTFALIRYKLYGDIETATRQNTAPSQNDSLTYASIGPVVYIKVQRQTNGTVSDAENQSSHNNSNAHQLFVLRKNLNPTSDAFEHLLCPVPLTTSMAAYDGIGPIMDQIGKINRISVQFASRIPKDQRYQNAQDFVDHQLTYFPKDEQEQMKSFQLVPEIQMDGGTWSVVQHFNFADRIKAIFREKTRRVISCYCWMFLFILALGYTYWLLRFFIQKQLGLSVSTLAYDFFTCPIELRHYPQFNQYDILSTALVWVAGFQLTAVLMTFYLFIKSYLCKYHELYHHFTALSEGLRVQMFWRMAGMTDAVSGHYRSHQTYDIVWLRTALNSVDVTLDHPLKFKDNYSYWCAQQYLTYFIWVKGMVGYLSGWDKTTGAIGQREKNIKRFYRKRVSVFIFVALTLFAFRYYGSDVFEFANTYFGMAGANGPWPYWMVLITIILGVSICCWLATSATGILFNKLMLFELEIKKLQQLIFPAKRANIVLCERQRLFKAFFNDSDQYQEYLRWKADPDKYTHPDARFDKNYFTEMEEYLEDLFVRNEKMFLNLGQIALSKNADWLLSMSERRLILPR